MIIVIAILKNYSNDYYYEWWFWVFRGRAVVVEEGIVIRTWVEPMIIFFFIFRVGRACVPGLKKSGGSRADAAPLARGVGGPHLQISDRDFRQNSFAKSRNATNPDC